MGEGTGGAASKTIRCWPKALHLISTRVCSGRGIGPFFALRFHACVMCASEHDVYFENSFCSRA